MLAAEESVVVPHELMKRMSDARRRSDALFSLVCAGSLYGRPIPERHLQRGLGRPRAAIGMYEAIIERSPSNVDAVRDYVGNIRSALDQRLEKAVLDPHSAAGSGFPLSTFLNVAVEHRLMHAETLAYMLHRLPSERKIAPAQVPHMAWFFPNSRNGSSRS